MADVDRRSHGGPRGGHNNRKRRFREDDEGDGRHLYPKRRFEEPPQVKLRKQLLGLAENVTTRFEDDITGIARAVSENYDEEEFRETFLTISLQLVVEQPLKIPFIAAVILVLNPQKPPAITEILQRAGTSLQEYIAHGSWREAKLVLRLLASLQGLLEDQGVLPLLEEIFNRAVDLQTTDSEDGLGLELCKIIQISIAYLMASSATGFEEQVNALLEKTDIIASTPHALEALVDPMPGNEDVKDHKPQSMIGLLQQQLQSEATDSWKLACLPRPWKIASLAQPLEDAPKHALPEIIVPGKVYSAKHPRLPEVYFSAYDDQDFETVPPTSNITCSIIRDNLSDTITLLDFNRNATARILIDLDCYFEPGTFAKRGTPFDKLRDVEGSTWKPEDVAVDALFAHIAQIPAPDHKLVYYHSVLTESCKLQPQTIAPSLGRAIRFFYRNMDDLDLEVLYRFMDWFSHHLSNFGFTWKWIEWVDDVELPLVEAKKAFMVGALDKEIRLSFARRIRGTLPDPYHALISEEKEKDMPDFKYADDGTPYAAQAREIHKLLRAKEPDSAIEEQMTAIQDLAAEQGVMDPLVPSTDAFVTSMCYLGSKSLSHALALIDRCKDRLILIGSRSEIARRQIITSVMEYWKERPGVGVNIIDKLLNYSILTPRNVIEWALVENLGRGKILYHAYIFEMTSGTVSKVTNRVRQIVHAILQPGLVNAQAPALKDTLNKERDGLRELFVVIEDAVKGIAEGSADAMAESRDQDTVGEALLRRWGRRWLRVFRRKAAVEEAWLSETLAEDERKTAEQAANPNRDTTMEVEGNGDANGLDFVDVIS